MEDNKKPSCLPSNYVTLVQLQERWLKEKEEKQKHKEQQEKQKKGEGKQEQKGKLQHQNAIARRSQPVSKSLILGRVERNQLDKPEASVSEVGVGRDNKNVDQEGKSINSKNKKKKSRKNTYRKKQNPELVVEERKEVTENDGVAHKPPANKVGEDVQGTRNKGSRGMEGKFRAKSSSRDLNRTKVEVETKFRDLSVHDSNGKGCNGMKQNPELVVEERKEVTENDGVAHKPPANEEGEDVQGTWSKESRGMEGKFRAKSSSRDLNRTKVEVETKFRDLSINDSKGKGCNEMKRTSTYNDRGKRELRDYGSRRLSHKQVRNPRDAGLIWVKKGEPFDGNVARMQTLEGSHSVSGLQDDIRFDVNIKQPRTLAHTIAVARLMEEQNQLQKRQSRQYCFQSTSATLNSRVGVLGPLPNQLLNPSSYASPTTSRRITNQKV
ncbi:hypothetical protein FEM48_Zijuj06G0044000 [Ziziphus jujuba var. spinosa]|uniref:Uncharacterized protein n=1 Tax=Ziziphus jujuba var. spinosa TaxID=714518 RepID=A0A978V754_ZIZJJ|nr:hypothetical protein FEM48_Zijuj06G0044000 [Ziziphus jujuba var. spinosa]